MKPVTITDLRNRLADAEIASGVTIDEALKDFHRALLESALEKHQGNQCRTAEAQKMHRNTLHRQMVERGINLAPRRKSLIKATGLPQARTFPHTPHQSAPVFNPLGEQR